MRKHILYIFFYTETFIKRHLKELTISVLIGFFATLFIFQVYPFLEILFAHKHLRVGLVGNYTWNNMSSEILNKVSFGLTTLSQDGSASPAATLNWDVTNNLIYLFHIKPNLFWHDGSLLKAQDINFKIKDVTVSYPDNYTLKLELKDPFAPILTYLSKPIIKKNFIGLGSYKVVRVNYDNNNQINEITIVPFDKKMTTLTYIFYNNINDALLGFKLGEVQELDNVDSLDVFKDWKNLKIVKRTDYTKVVSLFYNFKDSRFKEKEIRQALAYGIPEFSQFDKAVSPISPFSWAYSQKLRLYKYDPGAAQKILSKSPISSSSSELVLTTVPSLIKSAQFIVDNWKKLGINAKVKVALTVPSDFQVLLRTLSIPPDPDQYIYWQSTQENTNISSYSSPKIDKLLEDGRKTSDIFQRKKIYADFQFYLADDAPAIFLYYPSLYTITRN